MVRYVHIGTFMSGIIAPGTDQERRRHHRIEVSAPASFLTNDTIRVARCVSLSMGGAGLRTRTSMPSGAILKLKVSLSTGQIHTLAEVVRARGTDIGVRFVQLDPTSMDAILSSID